MLNSPSSAFASAPAHRGGNLRASLAEQLRRPRMTVGAVTDGRRGTLFLTEVAFFRSDEQLGGRGFHGPRLPSLLPVGLLCLCLAGLVLSGCARLGEAYALYNAHVDREIVAGRDEQRGNYAEIRWSTKAKAGSSSAAATADYGGTSGKAVAR
jgi:hypothetical protein